MILVGEVVFINLCYIILWVCSERFRHFSNAFKSFILTSKNKFINCFVFPIRYIRLRLEQAEAELLEALGVITTTRFRDATLLDIAIRFAFSECEIEYRGIIDDHALELAKLQSAHDNRLSDAQTLIKDSFRAKLSKLTCSVKPIESPGGKVDLKKLRCLSSSSNFHTIDEETFTSPFSTFFVDGIFLSPENYKISFYPKSDSSKPLMVSPVILSLHSEVLSSIILANPSGLKFSKIAECRFRLLYEFLKNKDKRQWTASEIGSLIGTSEIFACNDLTKYLVSKSTSWQGIDEISDLCLFLSLWNSSLDKLGKFQNKFPLQALVSSQVIDCLCAKRFLVDKELNGLEFILKGRKFHEKEDLETLLKIQQVFIKGNNHSDGERKLDFFDLIDAENVVGNSCLKICEKLISAEEYGILLTLVLAKLESESTKVSRIRRSETSSLESDEKKKFPGKFRYSIN